MLRTMAAAVFLLTLLGGAAPAGAELPPVDEPTVCFACHAEQEAALQRPHVHTAFREGKCSGCHNPHASSHQDLLARAPGELCLSCHDAVRQELARAQSHAPAREGACLACHDAHASDVRKQLRKPLAALCADCHAAAAEWSREARVHRPVREGNCPACHSAHGSEHGRLLVAGIPRLCLGCHRADASLRAAHPGFDPARANCSTCHDPHAAPGPGLLLANQHAPFRGGQCQVCHGASRGGELAAPADIGGLCAKCHPQSRSWRERARHHVLGDERSCLHCHNPHAASAPSLLAAEQRTLCARCHFTEVSAEERPRFLTHGTSEIECSSCHDPHGGDAAHYLRSTAPELCASCHVDAHRASHPMGPGVTDPRNGEPLTCLSCHQLHGAKFNAYLPLSPDRELCVQCHRK